ncbi:hypothetical protein HOLleu_10908 [Holothuria leucospilota]|uniref:Uncharacterized protein n=1 Tax=Holothuria leucospilota TaxID=206669 RepID=A0A9Q1CEY3_HOLLE|nr:hypothetical protein HOLleu_10908 [Holothuria leucospilota]
MLRCNHMCSVFFVSRRVHHYFKEKLEERENNLLNYILSSELILFVWSVIDLKKDEDSFTINCNTSTIFKGEEMASLIVAGVTALGFTSSGIAAGSAAAWMMSVAGPVASGSVVALCQSIGATGAVPAAAAALAANTAAGAAVGGVAVGGVAVKTFSVVRSYFGGSPEDSDNDDDGSDSNDDSPDSTEIIPDSRDSHDTRDASPDSKDDNFDSKNDKRSSTTSLVSTIWPVETGEAVGHAVAMGNSVMAGLEDDTDGHKHSGSAMTVLA